jgi:copper(I)-binding protein
MTKAGMRTLLAASAMVASANVNGQVSVAGAWVRGTVPGQTSSGAFMELKSAGGAVLVGADSPAAGVAEIHEMKMDGNVMRMRAVPRIELPAGKSVELKPGGYHLMLLQLKRQLKAGDTVPIRLRVEGKDKSVTRVDVRAEVRDPTGAPQHGH